jgi:hypothetical protein
MIQLSEEEYAALRGLAFAGVPTGDKTRQLAVFFRDIEKREGYSVYSILVRWQELNAPLPPGTNFPEVWPPVWESRVDVMGRPVALADVNAMLKAKATNPELVLVTTDLGGTAGWTKTADFFR